MFRPSTHSQYGSPDQASDGYDQYTSMLDQLAPTINTLLFGGSPREEVELARAKITNIEKLRDGTSSQILKNAYNLQLTKLYAQLAAAEDALAEAELTEQATRTGQALAIIGGAVGVVFLVQGVRTLIAYQRKAERG
jgi:hypothetical protein